jgi:DNA-binding beta-propeller fold protein YncE
MPPGEKLGWVVSGVAVGSRGDVYVLHRGDVEWPDAGELDMSPIRRHHGAGVRRPDRRAPAPLGRRPVRDAARHHGRPGRPRLDHRSRVPAGLRAHRRGQLIRTIGERGVAGTDGTHFDRPTKVAVAPDGTFYVSDGYRNSRVVAFGRDGHFLFAWGSKGSGPGEFDLPHGIALDRRGRVYVADRGNARVQIFDRAGRFLTEWKGSGYGRPFDVAVAGDGSVVLATAETFLPAA